MWKYNEPSTSESRSVNKPGGFIQPPFETKANEPLPKKLIPKDGLGQAHTKFFKAGAHLLKNYYALWDGYYIRYNKKVYPVVLVHNW